ncbi:zinc resistance protein [Escherichia coli]|uniref:Zinc resistance-associated protein n=1 Tax=Escherichia coli TaxID=562 RepID=A0A377CWY5_ECOLX|nr:zinc resistance protein [Escherichia coli]
MAAKCAPLTSEQQTAWQKIHNDFYAQSSALQQQLVTKRYEYNALLAANPPDSSKINAVAKEMENLRQSLDELRVKRDIAMAEAGIPRGTGMGYGGCGGGGHMGMGTGKSERFLVGLPATEIRVCHQQ